MFLTSHSGLSLISPSNGSDVFWNASRKSCGTGSPSGQKAPVVVLGSSTMPSTSAGLTPASSMALRMARMAQAPMAFCGSPSQRRSVGEIPDADGGDLALVRPHAEAVVGPVQPERAGVRVDSGSGHKLCPLIRSSSTLMAT